MKKDAKKLKRPRSIRVITAQILIFAFILWVITVYSATIVAAQLFYSSFLYQQMEFSHSVSQRLRDIYDDETAIAEIKSSPPGAIYALMHQTINDLQVRWQWGRYGGPAIPHNRISHRFSLFAPDRSESSRPMSGSILTGFAYNFQTSIVFTDTDGNIIMVDGESLTFQPIPQDVWVTLYDTDGEAQAQTSPISFDLGMAERMSGASLPLFFIGDRSFISNVAAIRVTGFMHGALQESYIHPVKICYFSNDARNDLVDTVWENARSGGSFAEYMEIVTGFNESGEYEFVNFFMPSISALDNAGYVQWQTMLDNTEAPENVSHADYLVTVYGIWPWISFNMHHADQPIIAGSNRYVNLRSFLLETRYDRFRLNIFNPLDDGDRRLSNIVVARALPFLDFTDHDPYSDELLEPDFIMLTAIHGNPLRHTISELASFYIWTLLITTLLAVVLIRVIKRNLTTPLEIVNFGISNGWVYITSPGDKPLRWREPSELLEHYNHTRDELKLNKRELTRLGTALNYAQEAEQNRRQMTSNIAHELKTPLAIIHSYSEGLKERIAEEKREQYLDVILSESERMDSMVLEMLDLSRLEAGKVKLATEEFSLAELARSIFDKYEMAISEKELTLSYEWDDKYIITADEARIGQVISNFATNAIKYTPHGGNIHVKIYTNNRGKTVFSIDNDSKPLSRRELSEIWESFYQADNARTGTGAGLGLAIAKSIIELHGGTCHVRNTKTGVEFSFVI